VTQIYSNAFNVCTSLTSVTMKSSDTIILDKLMNDNDTNYFRTAYSLPSGGGAGTYIGTCNGVWTKSSSDAEITAYSFPGETGPATINSGAGTIAVTVANATDVTSLVATFTTSAAIQSIAIGSTAQVSATTSNNFTGAVTYVVKAQDGTTKNWVVTVTAAPTTYTVTFDSQGGSAVAAKTSIASGGTVGTLPTAPTKTGYTFNGWFTAATGGTAFAATTAVTASITVYAQWMAITNVTSDAFATPNTANTVTITLTGGTFKTGAIVAADFTFTGSDADDLSATGAIFTRTTDTVVTITSLTGLGTSGAFCTVTVLAATWATQAGSVAVGVVASTAAAPVIVLDGTIANGASSPGVGVTGTNFKNGISGSDLTIDVGSTGLTYQSMIHNTDATLIYVYFAGTAKAGVVTIQLKTSAFSPASTSVSNILTINIP